MKVFEVLHTDLPQVSEEQILARLKSFDWQYEFAEDFRRISSGNRELELLENMVYQLWKTQPERAVSIWNEHCQSAPADKTATPSFILRLQLQEDDTK